jgi:DNA mismatch repair protein MutS2
MSAKKTIAEYEAALMSAEFGSGPSLDLHGFSAPAALHELDFFIHQAIYQKAPSVTIIHGRGTGALKLAIHAWLRAHPNLVPYFREALDARQGGVTFAVVGDE